LAQRAAFATLPHALKAARKRAWLRALTPNFGLPNLVYAGIPGKLSTQTGFGVLSYPTSPPTGLLGVGLGGDSSPLMIAFQARLEF